MKKHPMKRKLVSIDEARPAKCQHKKPCADCPFARGALRGWLGVETPEWFLAAAHGEVKLMCHTSIGAQCAGAAIFRANVHKFPRDKSILVLPPDTERCFADSQEFKEHHE